ncbi:hypothetical protein [Corynebacterium tuberculostearicum]|uniref:hypothetical protein n=2 Tax=Corynebacterium TaxID=1716 RepID=UPI002026F106|nr:hypothetical protein [Corynebacterium tuberculostearicum]MCG7457819.1 hypothetical protein [Corynebacterium tuberculostearicum]
MKLFSRKALVAGATALSMTFAGTTVATAAESTTQSTTAKPTTTKPAEPAEQGSSLKDADPQEIKAWIGVFTAVIGALGTLFAFANKYLDLPFGTK